MPCGTDVSFTAKSEDISLGPFEIPDADEIKIQINQSIERAKTDLARLSKIPDEAKTVENTLLPLEAIVTRFDDETLRYNFIADVCDYPDVAFEAQKASDLRSRFLNEMYLRSDLSDALSGLTADGEVERRLLSKFKDRFYPADLGPEVREELRNFSQNLSALEGQYLKNQVENSLSMNLHLIPEIMQIRHRIARLLGSPTFADYQIAHSGAGVNRTVIQTWLYEWFEPVIRASHEESRSLLSIKQMADPDATEVFDYEISSLQKKRGEVLKTSKFGIDGYFVRADDAVWRTNAFFSRFLSLDITPVASSAGCSTPFFLYCIADPKTGDERAFYYLVIRTNTQCYSYGQTYYLRSGRIENGKWIPPVSAIVLTIPKYFDTDAVPTLLSVSDVSTLFHEFGHTMRHSLSMVRYGTLSSGSQEDSATIEVPSLLFEKIFQTPNVYPEIMGDEVVNISSPKYALMQEIHKEQFRKDYSMAYTVFLSVLDLKLSSGDGDIVSWYSDLYQNITGFTSTSPGSDLLLNPSFFISNAGTYWHYALDDVYADCILDMVSNGGQLNMDSGILLDTVLFKPAGSVDTHNYMKNLTGLSCSFL